MTRRGSALPFMRSHPWLISSNRSMRLSKRFRSSMERKIIGHLRHSWPNFLTSIRRSGLALTRSVSCFSGKPSANHLLPRWRSSSARHLVTIPFSSLSRSEPSNTLPPLARCAARSFSLSTGYPFPTLRYGVGVLEPTPPQWPLRGPATGNRCFMSAFTSLVFRRDIKRRRR